MRVTLTALSIFYNSRENGGRKGTSHIYESLLILNLRHLCTIFFQLQNTTFSFNRCVLIDRYYQKYFWLLCRPLRGVEYFCLVCYVLVKMSNFLKLHVQITKLKIASNPFAKGFRESTRSRDHHNSFSHLPSPFYTQHAASMHFHPHHPGPHPHTPPTQFLHPRQLLEANQQVYSIDAVQSSHWHTVFIRSYDKNVL